jgi:undecaprenyl-diphosphatase
VVLSASELHERLTRFDDAVDRLFEPLRGNRRADMAAAVISNLADYGFAWSLVAAVKGRRPGAKRRRAVRALSLAGATSLGVNSLVKAAVNRQRPDPIVGGGTALVRAPRSSSFPSGHTLAAFCTAIVIAESPAEMVACGAFAVAVAASRLQLAAHHATDVVGGAAIGAAVGLVARRALRQR